MEASSRSAVVKVLFDVNVIIDIWGATEDFSDSYQSLDVTIFKDFTPCITSCMTPSIVCLLAARKYLSKQKSQDALGAMLDLVEVLDVIDVDCRHAQSCEMSDFEDALIACVAKRHGVDFIVTRNKKDFCKSPVPALTPAEFVALYKPTCLNYEMVEF